MITDYDNSVMEGGTVPELQDWLLGIPVLIALIVILLVEVTDR